MEIFILGAGHWETPVEVREKLALINLSGSGLYHYFTGGVLSEALILSTCNRLEIVGVTAGPPEKAREAIASELAGQSGISAYELAKYFHFHLNTDAVRYLFRVASGLDSQILGEPQILGQVKDSFREALKNRTVGPVVGKLFHKSFRTAKRARTETDLAVGQVSVASAAVEAAKTIPGGLGGQSVLVLGAGEMAALTCAHLEGSGFKCLTVMSRTLAGAEELAKKHGGTACPWPELNGVLSRSEVVFSAVGAQEPVITASLLSGLKRPLNMYLFDLGLPRNIEENAAELSGINLKNIDEIAVQVEKNQISRQKEVIKVESIIDEEIQKFNLWLSSLYTRPTIVALTRLAEEARKTEVDKTLFKHGFNQEQGLAVEAMSRALVRRILHNPLAFTKSCHRHGRADYNLDMVRRIFGLDE
jgi:glutamyl-tRNA reductase